MISKTCEFRSTKCDFKKESIEAPFHLHVTNSNVCVGLNSTSVSYLFILVPQNGIMDHLCLREVGKTCKMQTLASSPQIP